MSKEQAQPAQQSAFIVWLKNFTAGSVAGFSCKIVEYPFDTVKVLLQTAEPGKYRHALHCLSTVVKTAGFFSLYKGLASPLVGSMVENAVLFSTFKTMQLFVDGRFREYKDSPLKPFICGSFSGIATGYVLTPVELIKCRLQIQASGGAVQRYKGPIDCIKQTIREEGVSRGLFRGVTATLAREVPGNAAWFGVYENLCRKMTPVGGTRADLKPHQQMLAGGLSGMAYWTAFYPADTVKSQMQTNPQMAGKSFLTILNKIYTEQGFRALYKGWGITVSRALPSNAVLFFVYEVTSGLLNRI